MGIYNSKTIRKIRKQQKVKRSFLRDLFFPTRVTVGEEEVWLETTANGNQVAPIVSPIEDGRVVKEKAISTNAITAPSIAPKYVLTPRDAFKRDAGDSLNDGKSASLRMATRVGKILGNQENQITNKEELFAGQFLSEGKITSSSGDHPYEIDYKMLNKGTLGVGETWDVDTIKALDDLDGFIVDAEKYGTKVGAVVMDGKASSAFVNNPQTLEYLDNRRLEAIESKQKDLAPGVAYIGFYKKRSVHIYQYDRTLEENGAIKPIIPEGTIVGGPTYGEVLYAPVVYFKDGGKDIHEEIRHSRVSISKNGKEKSISTESRPVFQPSDMSAYFSWKVV